MLTPIEKTQKKYERQKEKGLMTERKHELFARRIRQLTRKSDAPQLVSPQIMRKIHAKGIPVKNEYVADHINRMFRAWYLNKFNIEAII